MTNGKVTTTSVSGSIRDNDIKPTVTLTKDSGSEVEEGSSKYIQITTSIDSVTTVPVTVILKSGGDAKDNDYYISDDPNDTINTSDLSTEGSFAPGIWKLANFYSAMYGEPLRVGPERGSTQWWATSDPMSQWVGMSEGCVLDDYVQFGSDGTFRMMLGAQTVLTASNNTDYCSAPVAPYLSGDYRYELDTVQVTDTTFYNLEDSSSSSYDINTKNEVVLRLIGSGAYLGLSKVNNVSENTVQDKIEYYITEYNEEIGEMVIDIATNNNQTWWRFIYYRSVDTSQNNSGSNSSGPTTYDGYKSESLWANGEPNNSGPYGEDYGVWTNGQLNDVYDLDSRRHILEIPKITSDSLNNYFRVGTYGGHTYYTSYSEESWNQSKQTAESNGGYLLVINNEEEYNWLTNNQFSGPPYHIGFYRTEIAQNTRAK